MLYSLIERFLDEHTLLASIIQEFKDAGDSANAVILLHKVKGGAGNLGILQLGAWAGQYESSLAGDAKWPTKGALEELDFIIKDLNKNFAAVDNPKENLAVTPLRKESTAHIKQRLSELLALVNQDLFAAEDILNDILECELAPELREQLMKGQEAMNQFDTMAVTVSINQALVIIG